MLIHQDPSLTQAIDKLLKIHQFNQTLSDGLIHLFYDDAIVKLAKKHVGAEKKKTISPDVMKTLCFQILSEYPVLKEEPQRLRAVLDLSVHQLNPHPFKNNLIYSSIKPQNVTIGKWHFAKETYPAFQPFVSGDIQVDPTHPFLEITPVGYFTSPFSYLSLKERDTTWMSLTPFEINSMTRDLSKVAGTVIALGLGLGYFAAMAANKPNVKDVIVVEQDRHVITLYEKYIQPHLKNNDKIKIVHADAYTFFNQPIKADHVFVDIYRTASDGLEQYIQFKKIEAKFPHIQWHYWLEQSILGLFRRYMMIYLYEQFHRISINNPKRSKRFADRLLDQIYRMHQAEKLVSVTQLNHWLSEASLKEMLTNIII